MFIREKTSQGCGVFFFDSGYRGGDSGYSDNSDYRGQIMHELCTNYARIYEWVNNFCGCLLQEETNIMNIIRERFDHVVNVVCNVMGMERAELLKSRKEEATDARSLLVYILGDELTDSEIAGVSEWTRQSVNFLRNNAYARIKGKWSLREAERLVRKALATDAQRII